MNKNVKNIVNSALFIALGTIIPMFFHMFGISGKIFLPMHIPVFIGGVFLNPFYALIVGLVTPLLSSVITGMPPIFPMAVIMIFELGAYGLITSLLIRNFKLNIFITLLISMCSGRLISLFLLYILIFLSDLKIQPLIFIKTGLIIGIPGIILQFLIIPLITNVIKKN